MFPNDLMVEFWWSLFTLHTQRRGDAVKPIHDRQVDKDKTQDALSRKLREAPTSNWEPMGITFPLPKKKDPIPDGNGVPRADRWQYEQLSRKIQSERGKHVLPVKLVIYPAWGAFAPVRSHKLECRLVCVSHDECRDHLNDLPAESLLPRTREMSSDAPRNGVSS